MMSTFCPLPTHSAAVHHTIQCRQASKHYIRARPSILSCDTIRSHLRPPPPRSLLFPGVNQYTVAVPVPFDYPLHSFPCPTSSRDAPHRLTQCQRGQSVSGIQVVCTSLPACLSVSLTLSDCPSTTCSRCMESQANEPFLQRLPSVVTGGRTIPRFSAQANAHSTPAHSTPSPSTALSHGLRLQRI